MVPAINEQIASVASATAPRHARAILLPTGAVIIDPASPGVLIKMDVVDPPYMAPYNTPANIIKADTGPTDTVTGNSNAIVNAGHMPGRMPIAVPNHDPIRAHIRLMRSEERREGKAMVSQCRYRWLTIVLNKKRNLKIK